jgi:hypothetical protein
MNSLLYYYNNVQKMAAYRQAKRMQRGVLTAQGGFTTTDPALLHVPCTIQCVFVPQTFESRQCVFDTRGSNASPRIDILENGRMSIYYSGTNKTIDISIGTLYNITFVTTETEQSVYVGGELLGSAPYSTPQFAYYVIGALTGRFMYRFKGDYLLHRHFNYAMSADEVKALDNNGDPMGYVVPKAMRRPEIAFPSGIYTESSRTFTQNNTQSTTATYNNPQANGFSGSYMRFDAVTTVSLYNAFWSSILKRAYPIKVTMEYRCNYDLYEGNTVQASGRMLATANDGDAKVVAIYYPNSLGNANLGIGNNNAPDAWLEIRVTSIESVGLFAEYLPQNLMGSRKESIGFTHFSTQNPYTFPGGVSKTMYCYLTRRYILGEGLKMRVKVSDYQSGVTTCVLGNVYHTIPSANGEYEFFSVSKLSPDDPASNYAMIYGSGAMTIEVLSIESVTVPTSWLDSAKQLPLSDEYIEPLFQSIGGYDMTANGVPEIIYNE